MEAVGKILSDIANAFCVFNVNGFYSIVYFLKHNIAFLFVLVAVGYLVYEELLYNCSDYVDDRRSIL